MAKTPYLREDHEGSAAENDRKDKRRGLASIPYSRLLEYVAG